MDKTTTLICLIIGGIGLIFVLGLIGGILFMLAVYACSHISSSFSKNNRRKNRKKST